MSVRGSLEEQPFEFNKICLKSKLSTVKRFARLYPTRPVRESNHDPAAIFSQLLLYVKLSASPTQLPLSRPLTTRLSPGCPVPTMREEASVACDLEVNALCGNISHRPGHKHAFFHIDSRSRVKRKKSSKRGIALWSIMNRKNIINKHLRIVKLYWIIAFKKVQT